MSGPDLVRHCKHPNSNVATPYPLTPNTQKVSPALIPQLPPILDKTFNFTSESSPLPKSNKKKSTYPFLCDFFSFSKIRHESPLPLPLPLPLPASSSINEANKSSCRFRDSESARSNFQITQPGSANSALRSSSLFHWIHESNARVF